MVLITYFFQYMHIMMYTYGDIYFLLSYLNSLISQELYQLGKMATFDKPLHHTIIFCVGRGKTS